MRQLGGFLLLVGLGTAVLPNLPQPDPNPHHDPYITHVLHGRCGKCYHRPDHWARRRRVYSWYVISPPLLLRMICPDPYPYPFTLLLIGSYRNAPDCMCEYLLCRD